MSNGKGGKLTQRHTNLGLQYFISSEEKHKQPFERFVRHEVTLYGGEDAITNTISTASNSRQMSIDTICMCLLVSSSLHFLIDRRSVVA